MIFLVESTVDMWLLGYAVHRFSVEVGYTLKVC